MIASRRAGECGKRQINTGLMVRNAPWGALHTMRRSPARAPHSHATPGFREQGTYRFCRSSCFHPDGMRSKLQLRFGIKISRKSHVRRRYESRARPSPQRKRGAQEGSIVQFAPEGERKGSTLGLWHGTLSRDLVQGAVVEAARHGGRDSRVHCRERRAIEGEGLSEPRLSTKVSGRRAQACRLIPSPCGLNVLLRLRQRTTRCSMTMVGHLSPAQPGAWVYRSAPREEPRGPG